MTQVFWLMWLSDVVGGLGIGCWLAVAIGAFAIMFGLLFCAMENKSVAKPLSYLKWLAIPFAVAVILPNASTVKLMAVASAADAASKTEIGAKGLEAINALLDRVITEAKAKK
jgi:heme/copper-type cytochrome/quinol oxidase subunit 3